MRSLLRNSCSRIAHASSRLQQSQRAASAPFSTPILRNQHRPHRSFSSPFLSTSTSTSSRALFSAMASSAYPLPCDKIVCLGKNYVEHQKEMGGPKVSVPVIFLKPPSCAVVATSCSSSGDVPVATVRVPRGRGSCHYETELVLRVGKVDDSGDEIEFDAVTVGLDLTLRDVQRECKDTGHPWESAKVFRGAAVLGEFVPLSDASGPSSYLDLPFELDLGGKLVQRGIGNEMMMTPQEAICYVHDELFEVRPGDLFFTGTPAGVGPVEPGQVAEVRLLKKEGRGGEGEALVRYNVRFE